MIVQRVEKHRIKRNNAYYSMFCEFTHKSKNLYNHANFLVREAFVKYNKWLRYGELDKILKTDLEYDDYKQMPTAQAAQQTLRLLEKDWKSFFAAIKDWSAHKDKYLGRPKLPKYKPKDGKHILILTNQNVKLKDGILHFPRIFGGFTMKPRFAELENFVSFQQVRFIPDFRAFTVELVYTMEVPDFTLPENGRYLSMDIGLDNLATIVNNAGLKPVIINGKGLKSVNKYYNKQISHYREIAKRMNAKDYTNRMDSLTRKRNHKMDDYMHKASSYIIRYALLNSFHTIVVGNNKEWKQNSSMGKKVNQSFVGIPHMRLIEMLQYKAQNEGIKVVIIEESYTSGTSFLDEESPVKENYNKKRRVYRGLFISNTGRKINADVNGAYQIMKKVFPKAFADGIEGVALHPVRVSIV